MNVHEGLLNNAENNCSFTEDEVDIMCSEDGDDACGDGCETEEMVINDFEFCLDTIKLLEMQHQSAL